MFIVSLITPPKSEPNLCSFLNKCSLKTSGYFLYLEERNVIVWKHVMVIAGIDGISPEQASHVMMMGHQACVMFLSDILAVARESVSPQMAALMTGPTVGSA